MEKENSKKEEYQWEDTQNAFSPYTYSQVADILDDITDEEASKLGFSDCDELWDAVNDEFTITELRI